MSIKTSLIIDLSGNLQARANQFLGGLQKLGHGGSRAMAGLQQSFAAAGRGLDKLGNRYTALLSGAAGIGAVKVVGDLSERLTYLGINAGVSAERISSLKTKIHEVAMMKDIRVNPDQLLSGVEKIVQKTGDLDLATENMRNLGLMIRATGAEGADVGDMIANFQEKFNIKTPKEMLETFDILVAQGHKGAFEFRDMVTQGNRITASYASMGRTGKQAAIEMGAMMQVFIKSSSTPEEASTAWKNVFNDMMEPAKAKKLNAIGVNIWDPEKLKEGKKQIRSVVDIIGEIMTKTKGDPEKLNRLFGMQSMDGLKGFITEYQQTGKNAALKFMNPEGADGGVLAESGRAAKEFNSALISLKTTWTHFADKNLSGPIKAVTDALDTLDPKTVDLWLKVMAGGAAVLGGAVLARKGWNILQWGRDLFRGNQGAGSNGIPEMSKGGATPVYVTNMPGSGFPGSGGATPPGAGSAASTAGKLAKYGSGLAGLAGGLALPIAGVVGPLALGITEAAKGRHWGNSEAGDTGVAHLTNSLPFRRETSDRYQSGTKWMLDMFSKMGGIKSEPQKTEVGGKIKIEIDDKRTTVQSVQTSNKNVPIDVNTGIWGTGTVN